MFVPPLHSHNNFEISVIGEVSIDPSVAIAPGVILQAAPNSQIIIGAGVCIGMGSIIHAYEGTISVEAGALLGSGCLIVGKSKIGANACVGSGTTVFNCLVAANQVVPPGSIISDQGSKEVGLENGNGGKRKEEPPTPPLTPVPTPLSPTPPLTPVPTPLFSTPALTPVPTPLYPTPALTPVPTPLSNSPTSALTPVPTPLSNSSTSALTPVSTSLIPAQAAYGQGSVKQLLSTLFPHKQILNKSLNEDKSE